MNRNLSNLPIIFVDGENTWLTDWLKFVILIVRPLLIAVLSTDWFVFPIRQRAHGECDRLAEDAPSSLAPDPTSYFCWRPCLLCSCFVFFFLLTFDFGTLFFITIFHAKNAKNISHYLSHDLFSLNSNEPCKYRIECNKTQILGILSCKRKQRLN